ncbi:MAG: hypothetical protein ACRDRH_23575 [Pseudonocardia sp.]
MNDRTCCLRCGAQLRLDNLGELCDPCTRQPAAVPLLPPEFFTNDERMRRALAGYDFATVLLAIRRTTGYSQERLGELIELPQERISRIERRTHRLRDIAIVARTSSRTGIPADMLGFTAGAATVGTVRHSKDRRHSKGQEEVDWMLRRTLFAAVTGITVGLGVPLDLDRLAALVPGPGAALPRRIGAADVTAIEQATAALRQLDFNWGGGLSRDVAVAQLRSVLALRNVACTAEVKAELLVATADLGLLAAFMSYDCELHADARRLWVITLEVARQAEHPAAVDLTVMGLLDMTSQALYLGQPEEAGQLVQLGYGAVAGGAHPVPASTASTLAIYQAHCAAARGDAAACDRALGRSVEQLTTAEPTLAGPWNAHVSPALLASRRARAYLDLAATSGNPRHAARAVPLLEETGRDFGPGYPRGRALNLANLARARAITGDLDTAVHLGGQAVTEITALSSRRALDRLRTLDTALRRHAAEAPVTELREQIRGALTTARA